MSAQLREKMRDVLRDENQLPPTEAASDVLGAVLFAMDRVDELWDKPGIPSTTDYAVRVVTFLDKRYLRLR